MSRMLFRVSAYVLSFLGFMIGFTSKVLAQYGAPEMHFRFMGNITSVECEQPICGVEVTLVNEVTGQIERVRTDENGNFSFGLRERYYSTMYTMNLADIDGPQNQGQFVSKSVQFLFDTSTAGINGDYYYANEKQNPMKICMDYEGENPCKENSEVPVVEAVIQGIINQNSEPQLKDSVFIKEPEPLLDPEAPIQEGLIFQPRLYPNPNSGRFVVECFVEQSGEVAFFMYTISGQLVHHFLFYSEKGLQEIPVEVVGLPPAVYIVRVISGQKSENFRVVIE